MLSIKQFVFEKINEQVELEINNLAIGIEDLFNFVIEYFPGTSLYTKIINPVEVKPSDNFFNIAKDIIEYSDEGFFILLTENRLFKTLSLSKNYTIPSELEKEKFLIQDKNSTYFAPLITVMKLNEKVYQFRFEKYDLVEFKSNKKENSYARFAKNQAPLIYEFNISTQKTIQEFLSSILGQINS